MKDSEAITRTRFRVHPAMAGYRLDQFLMRMIPRLSRNRIQKAIARRVRLSWDAPVKPSTPVREGGEVIIESPHPEEASIDFDPVVLYEDEDLLAIDKPPGLVVHPTHNHLRNTVISLLRRRRGEDDLTLAHRLDAETSGVLLLSRHRWAARKLQTAFERGKVRKHYLALVFGHPVEDAFVCRQPLGYHSADTVVYRQSPLAAQTRECETRFRVLRRVGRLSLVEAELLTGRRHQIRAHLALEGHPVVGDKLYGLEDRQVRQYLKAGELDDALRERLGADRCQLHCHSMVFPHPRRESGEIAVRAEMPADMARLLEQASSMEREA
ncbi:MAG: RluA family pseudouridine synthase [Acidobacteriota bacterium]|nr:RluA family pseudouridine synthase [Acidobacteriota bacterium]MDQ7087901.1 RluA family pseudouridine synthase [Acidobacteriota bacterium]